MLISTNRPTEDKQFEDVKKVIIKIGDEEYAIEDTIDGKVNIRKCYGGSLAVFPIVGNVIEVK